MFFCVINNFVTISNVSLSLFLVLSIPTLRNYNIVQPYFQYHQIIIFKFSITNMLLKPPPMLQEVISQDSEHYTNHSKNKSLKSKQGKKESTLRVAPSFQNSEKHKDYDNQSVHSNNSKKSRQKKSKETTLTRPPILGNMHKEDDTHSVRSNGSKHSNKSHKKESNIMQRPKIQNVYKPIKLQRQDQAQQYEQQSQIQPSFKAAIIDMEESLKLNHKESSPKPMKYVEIKKQKQQVKNFQGVKYRPFANIMGESQQQIPIFKIQEKPRTNQNNQIQVVGVNKNEKFEKKSQQSHFRQKLLERKSTQEESKSIFDNSRMITTKNPRRPIFSRQKDQSNNVSKLTSNLGQSNLTNIDDSKRKSSSRLRQIFNNSRQKNHLQGSIQNQSKFNPPSEVMSSHVKSIKPSVNNDKMVQLQKKILDNDNDNFNLQSSKSGLDLTLSNNGGVDRLDRDSLIFQFEPEKKSKGMTIVSSKNNKSTTKQSPQMIQLKHNNLVSVNHDKIKKDQLPIIPNTNLVSKDMKQIQKILKQNEDYLKNSALNLSSSYKPKNNKFNKSQQLFNLDEQQPIQCLNIKNDILESKPWHQIVTTYQKQITQPVVNIKRVERNQKATNKRRESSRQEQILKQKEIDDKRRRQQEEKYRRQKQKQRQKEQQRQRHLQDEKLRASNQQKQRKLQLNKKRIQEERRRQQQERRQQQQRRQFQERRRQQQQRRRVEVQQKRMLLQRQNQQRQNLKLKKQQKQLTSLKQQQKRQPLKLQPQQLKRRSSQPEEYILNKLTSQISEQVADNRSQNSHKSSKKNKHKKESSITRDKNHKIKIRNQSPRNQQSFYEEQNHKNKGQQKIQIGDLSVVSKNQVNIIKQDKKPNLYSFQEDNEEYAQIKSKTDTHFYDQSAKSIKPPSSKPPLSGRSGRSQSSSKEKVPKQTTIKISNKNEHKNMMKKQSQQNKPKKLTLMQRAMMKHNESQEDSQQSFSSREDKFSSNSHNSVRSNASKNSKKSIKQNVIKIDKRENSFVNLGKPPNKKKISQNSSHEQQLQHKLSKDNKREHIQAARTIISKNCTYIDENGKLVQKDLVIKGNKVYGVKKTQDSNVYAIQRMKRAKDSHRSRSKSRSKSRQNRHLQRRSSRESQLQSSSNYDSNYESFYQNSSYNQQRGYNTEYQNKNNKNDNVALRQFIKPVAQVPNYNKMSKNQKINQEWHKTSNNYQPNNNSIYTNMSDSRSKKTQKRTQKSNSKRF